MNNATNLSATAAETVYGINTFLVARTQKLLKILLELLCHFKMMEQPHIIQINSPYMYISCNKPMQYPLLVHIKLLKAFSQSVRRCLSRRFSNVIHLILDKDIGWSSVGLYEVELTRDYIFLDSMNKDLFLSQEVFKGY